MAFTKQERLAINRLKRLASTWPPNFWIWAAGGVLHVMVLKDGMRVTTESGGVDHHYIVKSIGIASDGGDW